MRSGEIRLIRRVTRMADMVGEKAHVIHDSRVLEPAMLVGEGGARGTCRAI
jgi:hypothetical protein